jgi:aryl-alcohol dehydrogenase-like predicted oxidoreductase
LKITLGTVQFGIQYGISNTHGVPSDSELESIFSVASELGIQQLDTAKAYGNAEERIGQLSNSKFDIITKFPNVTSEKDLEIALSESLQKLNVASIYAYLAHNADVLIQNPSLWEVLLEARKKGEIKKIGYSLYTPEQLERLLDLNCIPDLVQLPYSILDRKFEKQLSILKQLGTEVHVRSVFLQGLYFMNPNELPEKLQPLQDSLLELKNLCIENNVSVGEVALNYVISNPNIDKLVIGIETAEQLRENINLVTNWKSNNRLFSKIEAIKIKDKSLLNPVNW